MEHDGCIGCKYERQSQHLEPCISCEGTKIGDHYEKITHGDKIRSMSDEELAEFFEKNGMCKLCEHRDKENCFEENCKKGFLKWLQSEAEE